MYALIQPLDTLALHSTIDLVQAVPYLRNLFGAILDSYLVKNALPLTLLWVLWLSPTGRVDQRIGTLLGSLAGLVAALALGRAAQLLLPFRVRPLYDPAVAGLLQAPGLAAWYDGWSSFPSDHGALAGALIVAAFALSRVGGLVAAAWLLLLVCLPRLYFGLHWLSDVIAGLAIGAGITAVALRVGIPKVVVGPLTRLASARPALVLAAMFLVSFEIATLFDGTRRLAGSMARFVGV